MIRVFTANGEREVCQVIPKGLTLEELDNAIGIVESSHQVLVEDAFKYYKALQERYKGETDVTSSI